MTVHHYSSVFELHGEVRFAPTVGQVKPEQLGDGALPLREMPGDSLLSAFRCNWRSRIERRLFEIGCLKSGWDGHQGKPVNSATLDFTVKILVGLMQPRIPEPSIGATSYGGIQIEWHRKGWDLEIEIIAPNQLEVFLRNVHTDEIEEFNLGIALERLNRAVDLIKDI